MNEWVWLNGSGYNGHANSIWLRTHGLCENLFKLLN